MNMRALRMLFTLTALLGLAGAGTATAQEGGTLSPAYLDQLMAPVALYPDQLLARCSSAPATRARSASWTPG